MPVAIVTADNVVVPVAPAHVQRCLLLKSMAGDADEGEEVTIPAPKVTAQTWAHVVAFLDACPAGTLKIQRPLPKGGLGAAGVPAAVCAVMAPLGQAEVVDLMEAACYLEVIEAAKKDEFGVVLEANTADDLMTLCAAAIADMMHKLGPRAALEFFAPGHQYTPEEEAAIKEEASWLP